MDIKTKHAGEVALHEQLTLICPLIVKHFTTYDGQRTTTQNGRSKFFEHRIRAFRADCKELTPARIIIDDSYTYIRIKIDIHQQDPVGDYVNYFDTSVNIGSTREGNFVYEFNYDDTMLRCQQVTRFPTHVLEVSRATIRSLRADIDKVRDSVPPVFRELMKTQ